ncbi:MAG: LssY C-terminal domain-containing protein [Acidobacteriota bacterium]
MQPPVSLILAVFLGGASPVDPAESTGPAPATQPAAVAAAQTSPSTALLGTLTQASRASKDSEATDYLEKASDILSAGGDVGTCDAEGLTPLHWAIINGISTRKGDFGRDLEDLTQRLLAAGADVNAEDRYGNTPLDWQSFSNSDALQNALIEAGAENGHSQDETLRLIDYLDKVAAAAEAGEIEGVRSALAADLPCGTEIQIRLTTRAASNSSRPGDPARAVVTVPVMVEDRMVVAPGTPVEGSMMLARRAKDKYQQAVMFLDFANLVHANGQRTRLATRVVEVDNSRETVHSGWIVGAPFPNSVLSKVGMVGSGIGYAVPLVGPIVQAATFGFGRTYSREIVYEPGVDMTLKVLIPEKVAELPSSPVWTPIAAPPALVEFVNAQPLRVQAKNGVPSDLTNFAFIGTREQLVAAFESGGWIEAAKLGLKSGLKSFIATAQNRGYGAAPVSLLTLNGRDPDIVYQKQNNTFAKRHHIRIWHADAPYDGRDVWIGAGTHDIGIRAERSGTKWYHKIDSMVDHERAKVLNDLLFTGLVADYSLVDRPAVPRATQNATGDTVKTDGRMAVLWLR